MTAAGVSSTSERRLLVLLLALLTSDASAVDTAAQVVDAVGGNDVKAAPGVVAVLAIAFGLLCGLAGYRFLRPLAFVGGLVAGGYATAYAVEQAVGSDSRYAPAVSWLSFVGGGLAAGGAVFSVYRLAVFSVYRLAVLFVGAASGLVLAYSLYSIFGAEIFAPEPVRVFEAAAVVLGVLGAVAACSRERPVLIVATSFAGAGLSLYGFGYFAGRFPNAFGVANVQAALQYLSWWEAVPGAWRGYVAAFIALSAAYLVVQLEQTSPRRRVDSRGRLTDDRSRLGRCARAEFASYALSSV